jgi:hypothetical protein
VKTEEEETKPAAKSTGNVQKVTITDDVEYFGDQTKGMIIADTLSQRKLLTPWARLDASCRGSSHRHGLFKFRLGAPVVVLDSFDGDGTIAPCYQRSSVARSLVMETKSLTERA